MQSTETQVLNKLLQSPAIQAVLQEVVVANTPASQRFPDGLQWRYFEVVLKNKRWKFCRSTTKNENGRYLCWTSKPVKGGWKIIDIQECRTRAYAKKLCLERYNTFKTLHPTQ